MFCNHNQYCLYKHNVKRLQRNENTTFTKDLKLQRHWSFISGESSLNKGSAQFLGQGATAFCFCLFFFFFLPRRCGI